MLLSYGRDQHHVAVILKTARKTLVVVKKDGATTPTPGVLDMSISIAQCHSLQLDLI